MTKTGIRRIILTILKLLAWTEALFPFKERNATKWYSVGDGLESIIIHKMVYKLWYLRWSLVNKLLFVNGNHTLVHCIPPWSTASYLKGLCTSQKHVNFLKEKNPHSVIKSFWMALLPVPHAKHDGNMALWLMSNSQCESFSLYTFNPETSLLGVFLMKNPHYYIFLFEKIKWTSGFKLLTRKEYIL